MNNNNNNQEIDIEVQILGGVLHVLYVKPGIIASIKDYDIEEEWIDEEGDVDLASLPDNLRVDNNNNRYIELGNYKEKNK